MKETTKFGAVDIPDIGSIEIYRKPIKLAIQDCIDWIADERNDRHFVTLPYGLVKIDRKLLIRSHLF